MADDYRSLRVWRESLELLDAAYDLGEVLPVFERYELARQVRRAAVSIIANIAEGNGRIHRREYVYHLSVARGSVTELRALTIIAERRRMIPAGGAAELQRRCDVVSRMLHGMIQRLSP